MIDLTDFIEEKASFGVYGLLNLIVRTLKNQIKCSHNAVKPLGL